MRAVTYGYAGFGSHAIDDERPYGMDNDFYLYYISIRAVI